MRRWKLWSRHGGVMLLVLWAKEAFLSVYPWYCCLMTLHSDLSALLVVVVLAWRVVKVPSQETEGPLDRGGLMFFVVVAVLVRGVLLLRVVVILMVSLQSELCFDGWAVVLV